MCTRVLNDGKLIYRLPVGGLFPIARAFLEHLVTGDIAGELELVPASRS